MNEALQDAYNLFIKGGYNGTIEDFSALISTNPEALNDSFQLFAEGGYNGTSDDYIELIGLKKKTIRTYSNQVSAETLWVQILGLVVWNRQCWTKSSELNKTA